ncbi:hypothetical protein Q7P37_002346 [Cladosporium fusiforme]
MDASTDFVLAQSPGHHSTQASLPQLSAFQRLPQEILDKIVAHVLLDIFYIHDYDPPQDYKITDIVFKNPKGDPIRVFDDTNPFGLHPDTEEFNLIGDALLKNFAFSSVMARTAFDQFFFVHPIVIDAFDFLDIRYLPDQHIRLGRLGRILPAKKIHKVMIPLWQKDLPRSSLYDDPSPLEMFKVLCKFLPRIHTIFPALKEVLIVDKYSQRLGANLNHGVIRDRYEDYIYLYFDLLYTFFKLPDISKKLQSEWAWWYTQHSTSPFADRRFNVDAFEKAVLPLEPPV